MKLSTFITDNRNSILEEWEKFAASIFPDINPKLLRDHASELLDAIISDMEAAQTSKEQVAKSKGGGEHRIRESGVWHAVHRIETGFSLLQVISEYRYPRP